MPHAKAGDENIFHIELYYEAHGWGSVVTLLTDNVRSTTVPASAWPLFDVV
jgi:hypothetical protein